MDGCGLSDRVCDRWRNSGSNRSLFMMPFFFLFFQALSSVSAQIQKDSQVSSFLKQDISLVRCGCALYIIGRTVCFCNPFLMQ